MPESAAAILPTPEQVLQALLTPRPPRAPAQDWNSPMKIAGSTDLITDASGS